MIWDALRAAALRSVFLTGMALAVMAMQGELVDIFFVIKW
jgi:hypothetical protein